MSELSDTRVAALGNKERNTVDRFITDMIIKPTLLMAGYVYISKEMMEPSGQTATGVVIGTGEGISSGLVTKRIDERLLESDIDKEKYLQGKIMGNIIAGTLGQATKAGGSLKAATVGGAPVGVPLIIAGEIVVVSSTAHAISNGVQLALVNPKGGSDGTDVPQKAHDVADEVLKRNGTPPQGHRGGRTFANDGRDSGQVLPEGNYKEYDVNPYVKGQNRGTERLVIGEDGSAWYTNDHYRTFKRIR